MKAISILALLYTLIVPITLGSYGLTEAAWIAVLCGVFVTIATRLEDLQEITFGPLKARLREIIREASATVEQLKGIAEATARVNKAELIAQSFPIMSLPFRQRLEFKNAIDAALKKLGLGEEEIRATDEYWRKGVALIFHRRIRNALPEDKRSLPEVRQLFEKDLADLNSWRVANPKTTRAELEKHALLSDEVLKELADYEQFSQTGAIPDHDSWEKE